MKTIFKVFAFLYFIGQTVPSNSQNHLKLWYKQPAISWNEALPIGNGRLAAMVFGNPQRERLQLNEETVWAGEPGNNIPNTNFAESLQEIRNLLFTDQYEAAQNLAMLKIPRHAGATNNYGMPYQPVGNVFIDFPEHQQTTYYTRELNISTAIQTTTYTANGINFKREIFTSFSDQVIIVRLTADQKQSITCAITADSPHKNFQVQHEADQLILSGVSGDKDNKKGKVKFVTLIQPILEDGTLESSATGLQINKASAVTLFISIGTNFKNYHDLGNNANEVANQYLKNVIGKGYSLLTRNHTQHYQNYFNRVTFELGTPPTDKPTDVRIQEFKAGNDPQLAALYFQFGRYLLISSSQPESQPANLQGKWNDLIAPPWDSKYTVNINTEMNYWPAEITGLSEMHEPLFKMLKELEQTGQESATTLYHARGWNLHHNTDLWRITGPVDGAFYGLWPMGGAWLSQHLWQHYLFTGDVEFLKTYYTVLKGAALFYHDVLQEEPATHWLVVAPSMSPENNYQPNVSISAGTTMDNQLVFDVFTNFMEASRILKIDGSLRDSIKIKRDRLPPMQIGRYFQLQEWLHDWDQPEDKHRHISHLYGLYPSAQISPFGNKELFQAAKNSLEYRGDQSTGWSMGWKVNWWARLLDGNRAYKLITDQLTPALQQGNGAGGTYPNLLDAHPPFQIDGNFGCTSGIAEMLIQSHDGAVHLLPALPDKWTNGKITGLRTRGGFIIDLTWKNSKVNALHITSTLGGNLRIRNYNMLTNKQLKNASGLNPNSFFTLPEIKAPIISKNAPTQKVSDQKKFYEYDLQTKKGKTYTFNFSE